MTEAQRGSRGFTLIELLVVVAIIAVLAAILFPVYAGARGKARQSTCLSNLRQLGMGMLMYVRDYYDTYPFDVKPRAPARPGAVSAYDGTNKWDASPIVAAMDSYLKNKDVSFCPDQPREIEDLGPLTNYEFNGFIALNDSAASPNRGRPVRIHDVEDPSHVLIFEDYSDSPDYHAGFRNFSMADGRAATYPSSLQAGAPCHAKWWVKPE